MPAKGRTSAMKLPIKPPPFSLEDFESPLQPITWAAKSVLLLEGHKVLIDQIRASIAKVGAPDLEIAKTADEALDMIGYASRPFDVILLSTCGLLADAQHVIEMLRRQQPQTVAFAYFGGQPPDAYLSPKFIGIADWLDIAKPVRWTRSVAQNLDAAATVRSIISRGRVPWHATVPVAHRVYRAKPGDAFQWPPAV
jgi:hypothetical protein